jgi:LysM repeat protein
MRIVRVVMVSLVFLGIQNATANSGITKEQYIQKWKDVAIRQMIDYKIPASITLAQGILESGYGNSDLARLANNHFGIKCNGWKGKTYYKDDDKKQECFRSYKNAAESYKDHSLFLTGRAHYASLFELDVMDYKSWAKGLKKAGYATHPKYAEMLIELIENHELYRFDQENQSKDTPSEKTEPSIKPESTIDGKDSYGTHQRKVEYRNKVKCVVAQKGDTYYRIAKEFQMGLWQLYRYNDFNAKKDVLSPGDVVYLQPKRAKSFLKQEQIVSDGIKTFLEYSQDNGIKVSRILRKNGVEDPSEIPSKGKMVFLK